MGKKQFAAVKLNGLMNQTGMDKAKAVRRPGDSLNAVLL